MLNSREVEMLNEFIKKTENLQESEDYHDLEDFGMKYGGFEGNEFIDLIKKIIKEN